MSGRAPRKAIYQAIEDGESIAFDFYLALKLKKTIGELHQMSNAEYEGWLVWFARESQLMQMEQAKRR